MLCLDCIFGVLVEVSSVTRFLFVFTLCCYVHCSPEQCKCTEQQHQEEPPPAKLHKHNSEQPRTIFSSTQKQSTPLSQDR